MFARHVVVERDGRAVVAGATVSVEEGEVAWLRGPSGTGKSTLLAALARLLPLSGGEIHLQAGDGGPPWCHRARDASRRELPNSAEDPRAHVWRSRVLLLPFPPVSLGATVEEDLLSPYRLWVRRHRPAPDQAALVAGLRSLGLGDLAPDHPVAKLSQGQAARVALLRALLADPEVLLLDEPTANLDPEATRRVADRVMEFARSGRAVLVAAHAPPWDGVSRVYRIEDGRPVEEAGA